MNTGNWSKLYGNIIHSTIWQENPETKCVWLTMIALADREGYVGASVPGLARAAVVSLDAVEKALAKFKEPDQYSRSPENEGRRIEERPGGWQILNYEAHRDGDSEQKEKWRLAKQRQREKQKTVKQVPLAGETAAVKAYEAGQVDAHFEGISKLTAEEKADARTFKRIHLEGGKGQFPEI